MEKTNEWIKKYKREYPFMPFGSIMNSYGLINKGSNKKTSEFLKDVDLIFQKCVNLVHSQLPDETPEIKQEPKQGGLDDLDF